MSHIVRLNTDLFDISQEPENPINPIPGVSLLQWLKRELNSRHAIEITDPDAEDWGWYSYTVIGGRNYMLGASSDGDDGEREWRLLIEKHRTYMEKLLGKAKMTPDDEAVATISALIAAEPAFRNVSVD